MSQTEIWERELLEKLRDLYKLLNFGDPEFSRNYLKNIIGDFFEPE